MSTDNRIAIFSKPGDLMDFLKKGRSAVEMALPKHLNADRMLRLAVTCFSTTPKLRECTAQSILSSIVVASQLGLEPGVGGQAYLIPYGNTCTLVPGWQGLAALFNNTGRGTAWTGAVFEGDVWDFQLGSAPRCIHIPGPNFGDPEKLIWVYACGKVNGSEQPVIEAWPMSRVYKHRDRFNKVGRSHYSYTHPEMYGRKVVFLQVMKYMPKSIELQNAITAAVADDKGNTSTLDEGVVVEVEAENVERVASPRKRKEPPVAPANSDAEVNNQPPADPIIPEEPSQLVAFLKEELRTFDIDEAQALKFLKAKHKCGAASRILSDAPPSGLRWLAEGLSKMKDEISAQ